MCHQAHLAEEVPRAEFGDAIRAAPHLGGALLDREKLVGKIALVHQLPARGDVDLLGVVADFRELLPGERGEQRYPAQVLLVHGISPSVSSILSPHPTRSKSGRA